MARNVRVSGALVEAICPPEVSALGVAAAVVDDVRRVLDAAAPMTRLALRTSLAAMSAGMPVPRTMATAVRDLLVTVAYEQPEVHAALGYDPAAWVARTAARRAERWAGEIDAHAAALLTPDPLVPGGAPSSRPGRFVSATALPASRGSAARPRSQASASAGFQGRSRSPGVTLW